MRAVAILAAIAMIVSLFLPWFSQSIPGLSLSPLEMIRSLDPDVTAMRDFVSRAPLEVVAFLSTFLLAAVFVMLALFNLPSRVIAIVGGGIGVGLIGMTIWQFRKNTTALAGPISLDFGNPDQVWALARDMLGYGAWAWGIGALVLLLSGLIGFSRR